MILRRTVPQPRAMENFRPIQTFIFHCVNVHYTPTTQTRFKQHFVSFTCYGMATYNGNWDEREKRQRDTRIFNGPLQRTTRNDYRNFGESIVERDPWWWRQIRYMIENIQFKIENTVDSYRLRWNRSNIYWKETYNRESKENIESITQCANFYSVMRIHVYLQYVTMAACKQTSRGSWIGVTVERTEHTRRVKRQERGDATQRQWPMGQYQTE